jgi:transposase
MGHLHTEEFKREAVRLAKTSGLTRKQVAADLGIGLSTLGKWISADRPEARAELPQFDLLKKVEQLRRENRILKDLRG